MRVNIQFQLRLGVAFLLSCTVAYYSKGQTYSPITVYGFNQDVIAEGSGRSSLLKTNCEMDAFDPSNFVICTREFARANNMPVGYGLPDNGNIPIGNKTFVLNPYSEKNALYLFRNQQGRLRLRNPKNYSSLSVLGLATEGSAVLNIVLKYTDSTQTEFSNKTFPDWFDGPQPVLMGFGRVKRANGSNINPLYYEGVPANPRFYDILIPCNQEKKIAYVLFRNVSAGTNSMSNRAFVFGISGVVSSPAQEIITKKEVQVPVEKKITPTESVVTPDEKKQVAEPVERKEDIIKPKKIFLEGSVKDSKTNKPVQAKLNFLGKERISATSNVDGEYSVEFIELFTYSITIEASGYMNLIGQIDLGLVTNGRKDFLLTPIEVGTLVKLNSILFEQSSPRLKPESFQELDQVVDFLKNNPGVTINLAGHTDNRGARKLNLKLSEDRVVEVKKYLVQKGIDSRRISGKGYGSSKPIAKGNNEEAWRLNRRVEFTITGM